jgi:E3 ubiquitin-protein ligase UBR7
LRINEQTGTKGAVHSEEPAADNKYNHNFRNQFCICGELYDAQTEQGTMFQCLGLGSVETGGCGEDWYHPECVMGLSRDWKKRIKKEKGVIEALDAPATDQTATEDTVKENAPKQEDTNMSEATNTTPPATNGANGNQVTASDIATRQEIVVQNAGEDDTMPPGFPNEDDFEDFLCYKCIDANPWIKKYAGSRGFHAAIPHRDEATAGAELIKSQGILQKKRKASPDLDDDNMSQASKRQRGPEDMSSLAAIPETKSTGPNGDVKPCIYDSLPLAPEGSISLFTKDDFRTHLCRCPKCYPALSKFPQLMEEEETYEPPISEDGDDDAPGSLGSRSLLDRGEAALSNVDRVRAIEGVMVYNHLKDKVKSFLKPFAESGQAVGAEDIKKYFEGLRGDADAISAAARKSNGNTGDRDDDSRKEQSGESSSICLCLGRLLTYVKVIDRVNCCGVPDLTSEKSESQFDTNKKSIAPFSPLLSNMFLP